MKVWVQPSDSTTLALPVVGNLPVWPEVSPGATDYEVGQGESLTLPVGAYGVDSDADEMTLLQRVYDRFGYSVVYIRQVGVPLPVRRISSPRVVRR